jgi:predicted nucleic acid-binding protein
MADVLADTSAWIAALRGADRATKETVDRLLDEDRLVFCGVVEMELLHGIRPAERRRLLPLFAALPYVEADRADWQAAGELLGDLRAKGVTIPATDALVAALCRRHGFRLLSLDRHFDAVPLLHRLPR